MHDVTAPNIIMKWRVLCANPVEPEDWDLVYNKSIHYGDTFEMRLAIKPDKPLPTKPSIRVYAVIGFPKTPSTAMRRFDHAPFFSMQKTDYAIPFYVKNDLSEEARRERENWINNPNRQRRGWWETPKGTIENGLPPPEVLTYEEYTFKYLGMENEEERLGNKSSGGSATTNLKSPGEQFTSTKRLLS